VALLGLLSGGHCVSDIMSSNRDVVNWDYTTGANGQTNWHTLNGGTAANTKYPGCGGAGVNPNQSPINIVKNTLATPAVDPGTVKLNGYTDKMPATLFNTGRHLAFKFGQVDATNLATPFPPLIGPIISGGPLPAGKAYIFDHAEIHWGPSDTMGSEHTVDGTASPLEIQLVHYDSTYANLQAATLQTVTQKDSVVVISVLGVANGTNQNTDLEKIIATLPAQATANNNPSNRKYPMNDVCLSQFFPAGMTNKLELDDYYYYDGSLTHPGVTATADTAASAGIGCQDNALWLIAKDPVSISTAQLTRLRTLQDESGNVITASVANSRSVQALGTRTVNHRQRAAPNAQLKSNTVSQIAATLASSLLSVGTFAAVMNVLQNNDEAAAALRENPMIDLIEGLDQALLGGQDEVEARQQEVYPEEHHVHQLHHSQRY